MLGARGNSKSESGVRHECRHDRPPLPDPQWLLGGFWERVRPLNGQQTCRTPFHVSHSFRSGELGKANSKLTLSEASSYRAGPPVSPGRVACQQGNNQVRNDNRG